MIKLSLEPSKLCEDKLSPVYSSFYYQVKGIILQEKKNVFIHRKFVTPKIEKFFF